MENMKPQRKSVGKRANKLYMPIVAVCVAVVAAVASFFSSKRIGSLQRKVQPISVTFLSMGTMATLDLRSGGDAEHGAEIVRAAFDEVEAAASVFRKDSAISRLNRDGSISLPPVAMGSFDLGALLRRTLAVAEDTNGAFDPTINPLMRLWGFRGGNPPATTPTDEEIAATLEKTGWRHIAIVGNFAGGMTIFLGRSGMELDLGGIAKGAAVDLAYDRLLAAGFENFSINLGGNIRVSGRPESGRDIWKIAIRDPDNPNRTTGTTVALHSGEAVATSGSYERFIEIDGIHYSHIIDPRNGRPAARSGSVSVIATTATEADAYSTALFVNGAGSLQGGATVINRVPHAQTSSSPTVEK